MVRFVRLLSSTQENFKIISHRLHLKLCFALSYSEIGGGVISPMFNLFSQSFSQRIPSNAHNEWPCDNIVRIFPLDGKLCSQNCCHQWRIKRTIF